MLFPTNANGKLFFPYTLSLLFIRSGSYAVWFGGSLLASLVSYVLGNRQGRVSLVISRNSIHHAIPRHSMTKLARAFVGVIRSLVVLPNRMYNDGKCIRLTNDFTVVEMSALALINEWYERYER
jgi:hypothetical protein